MNDDSTPAQSRLEDLPAYLLERLTPQMRDVLEHQFEDEARRRAEVTLPEDPTEASRAEYRAERAFWNEGGPTMASTRELQIHAAGIDVPVRIHLPVTVDAAGSASGSGSAAGSGKVPAILFFHGGGFTLGDLDTHDRIHRMIAHHSGAAVVAVDYSLSPEVKFPQALRECAGVTAHVAEHGEELGLDGSRLAFAGDSAGSGLSIGAALLLRDEAPDVFARLQALVLIYGGFGLKDSAARRLWGGWWDGMKMDDLSGFQEALYADPADADSSYVQTLRSDLSGLPPVFMRSAELDPLADDTAAFAQMLRRAGHTPDVREVPGVLHSYLHFGRLLDEANFTLTEGAQFIAARFAQG
ncbi:alpha/beta hydrolase fold domain-containing protein [Brevibacterium jeotgali]|uniref:Acetyl esterase n=1 Tax=Brevibacterium jeotgali TaxID=1262550 RepID=A0A2H1L8E1_9MICO|nr:alpha/beta hydrolase fold domain-containing protein [Brevibacterium jeotgali]TWB98810.1 acetyl esterase [Brevibacterium jeotgali]SMY13167.1 acetyl esterase [Brevibacterium jeotgali]